MFSNILSKDSPLRNNKNDLQNLFTNTFQNFLRKGFEADKNMLSARTVSTSEDGFMTPVSSVADLMTLSPNRINDSDIDAGDLLTGDDEFDNTCEITMQEIPQFEDNILNDVNSLDYLVNCTASNRKPALIDRGKESLFVKFDPLYACQKKSIAESVDIESTSGLPDCDNGYETGSSVSAITDSHIVTPRHCLSFAAGAISSNKEKPTQVVPPVKSIPSLVRSVSAILTPSQVATDHLISISGTTPPTAAPRSPRFSQYSNRDKDCIKTLKEIIQKQDEKLYQLRYENRELKSKLFDVEHFVDKVNKITEERDLLIKNKQKLTQIVEDKIISNKQLGIVMEEYEKTISALIDQQHREKVQSEEIYEKFKAECDQALSHLSSMESSFSDLLTKYEKCKQVIMELKDREKVLVEDITENEKSINQYEMLYNNLKTVTSESLANANETLENIRKHNAIEVAKLSAQVKKHEITISSLQESLTQKIRDNEELAKIFDQLVNENR